MTLWRPKLNVGENDVAQAFEKALVVVMVHQGVDWAYKMDTQSAQQDPDVLFR